MIILAVAPFSPLYALFFTSSNILHPQLFLKSADARYPAANGVWEWYWVTVIRNRNRSNLSNHLLSSSHKTKVTPMHLVFVFFDVMRFFA